MEIYKKLREYEEMVKDGVITEEECQKLKSLLYSAKMAELGIQDEAEFEEILKKDVFKEAVMMLENNTIASYREAISCLEKLGDWGNAVAVIEQCRTELHELEKEEAKKKEEQAKKDLYDNAVKLLEKKELEFHKEALKDLESLGEWGDAAQLVEKTKTELPELEKKDAAAKIKIEKKIKKTKTTLLIAAIVVVVAFMAVIILPDMFKLDLMKHNDLVGASVHGIEYGVPEDWHCAHTSGTYQYYTLSRNDTVVAAFEVAYMGDTDLEGAAGYDDNTAEHKVSVKAIADIPDAEGYYQMVYADNSAFEVTVYSKKDRVKNQTQFLDLICGSFKTKEYKNPRELKNVEVEYDGITVAGTKVNDDRVIVTAEYDTGVATGTTRIQGWKLKEPVTLEAGKTSTITVVYDGDEYSVDVRCSTPASEEESKEEAGDNDGSAGRHTGGGDSVTGEGLLSNITGDD